MIPQPVPIRARLPVGPPVHSPEWPQGGERSLRDREREVLWLLAQGYTQREIAGELGISRYTVRNHITNIMGKLGARNSTHAAALAARGGVLA